MTLLEMLFVIHQVGGAVHTVARDYLLVLRCKSASKWLWGRDVCMVCGVCCFTFEPHIVWTCLLAPLCCLWWNCILLFWHLCLVPLRTSFLMAAQLLC